jgi:hypothetical protein
VRVLGHVTAICVPSTTKIPKLTLGWTILDWITDNLAQPDRSEYEPYVPTREQAEFILHFYEVDQTGRRRRFRRAVVSRPKGWG